MSVKLLTEHHLEFLSFKGDCTSSSESALVKMAHCWKSHALAQMIMGNISSFDSFNICQYTNHNIRKSEYATYSNIFAPSFVRNM